MSNVVSSNKTFPPKRLLYKGFHYVLAERGTPSSVTEIIPIVEELLVALKDIAADEHTLVSNKQIIAGLWPPIREYFKLLIPQ